MPRPRPPHLHLEKGRWIVRIGHGRRVPIKARYGTREFREEYTTAIHHLTADEPGKARKGAFKWLWSEYCHSADWQNLSEATRKQRGLIMRPVLADNGDVPYIAITRKDIIAGRDRRKDTPAMARHFVETMRGLFRWALDAELVDEDPTRDVKAAKIKTDGHHTWSRQEIMKFRETWALGTRERLAFEILFNTGLRRSDAARLGPANVIDNEMHVSTEKTGAKTVIPIMPALAEALQAGPCGASTFIASQDGSPMSKEGFGNWFGQVCRATGVEGTAHGLRKALATILAEEGATVHELESLFAWSGGGMASLYTRKANRAKMARAAIGKISADNEILFPKNGIPVAESDKS